MRTTSVFAAYAVILALAGCDTPSSDPTATAETSRPPMLESAVAMEPQAGESSSGDGLDPTGDATDSMENPPPGGSSNGALADKRPADTGTGDGAIGYGDAFSSDTLASWSLRHLEVGEAPRYTLLDIDRTQPGALTIEPTRTPGWFAGGTAPLIFKRVSGDFSVEVDVLAESAANPGEPPGANFNSAGLMARDPSSDAGSENYVMVNLGRQNGGQSPVIGTESKTTRNSSSTLDIQAGTNRGRLILCRVGSDFRSYRLLDNEVEWRRIASVPRPDLPDSLQVGMVANGFEGPDLRATFFEISLRVPQSLEDCTPR